MAASVDALFRAVQALARAGHFDAAVARLHAHLKDHADDHAAWHQLARIESQRRHPLPALKAARRAAKLAPNDVTHQRWLGLMLANAGAAREAMALLAPLVQAAPDDYLAMHALHLASCRIGDAAQILRWGSALMAREDRHYPPLPVALPAGATLRERNGRRRVIAFSLWGDKPVYNLGAIINARLAPFMYPGWTPRFYLARDVPASTRAALADAGAQIVEAWQQHPDVSPSMWRFMPADDPDVGVFICRDCDSRPSPKETAAVEAWLASGRWGHVMRDHVLHRNVMLAGLWGARANESEGGRRLFMRRRLQRFLRGLPDARHGADQLFLAKEIWPVLRDDCMIHDSYYPLFGAQPFPVMGKGNDRFHVGMAVLNARRLQREARLLGVAWPAAPEKTGTSRGS